MLTLWSWDNATVTCSRINKNKQEDMDLCLHDYRGSSIWYGDGWGEWHQSWIWNQQTWQTQDEPVNEFEHDSILLL